MPNYHHKLVQGLEEIINKYAGHAHDPILKAIWFGIKGQVPVILATVDNNPELVEEMRRTILEYCEPERPVEVIEQETMPKEIEGATVEETIELDTTETEEEDKDTPEEENA